VTFHAISQQHSDADEAFTLIVNGSGFQAGHLYFCSFTCISSSICQREFWNAPSLAVPATWTDGADYVTCAVERWPHAAARTLFELNRGSTSTIFDGAAGGNIYTFAGKQSSRVAEPFTLNPEL
jgi:hypothetical protein